MNTARRAHLIRLLAALGLCLAAVPSGAGPTAREEQLKAAFVFNFVRYIDWPVDGQAQPAQIVACVIGSGDAFGQALAEFDGRAVAGRTFTVKRNVRPDAADSCQIAVLADVGDRAVFTSLDALPGQAVLTVSDVDGFVEAGGMIGLVRNGDRLQFDINAPALQRANLRASSQLLKLARNLGGGRAK